MEIARSDSRGICHPPGGSTRRAHAAGNLADLLFRYLILIEHTHILPALYGHVFVPPIVMTELSHEQTPDIVRRWIANPPDWVRVQDPTRELVAVDQSLGAGERAAIALADCRRRPAH